MSYHEHGRQQRQYQQGYDDGYDRYADQSEHNTDNDYEEAGEGYEEEQEPRARYNSGRGGGGGYYDEAEEEREYASPACSAPPGWFEGEGMGSGYDGDGRGASQYGNRNVGSRDGYVQQQQYPQQQYPQQQQYRQQQQQQYQQQQYQQQQQYPQQQQYQQQHQQHQQYRQQQSHVQQTSTTDQGFEYSRCNGSRKALLIGINYFGSSAQLNGCINDVGNVKNFLSRYGYAEENTVVLTDDQNDADRKPTRANILRGMQWLVQGAKRDDALFFHYSGHGTQAKGGDSTEADGMMEAICPVDYESAGLIVDRDSQFDIMCKPLPSGCRLTAIFDSCHSGTVLNLPYVYSTHGTVKEPNMLKDAGQALLTAVPTYARGDSIGALKGLLSAGMASFKEKRADEQLRGQNTLQADVIMFSGCKDNQTSADATEAGEATGAMSYAFVQAFGKHPQISYKNLLVEIRRELQEGKYTQKPQLSACHPIDTNLDFVA